MSDIRIPVTWLDQLDYAANQDHPMEAEALIQRLVDPFVETEKMRLGKEFEAWLEGQPGALPWSSEGLDIELPRIAQRQVRVGKKYKLTRGDVYLSGRMDAIDTFATRIDWKCTWRNIGYEDYADAWQWRAYLAMGGGTTFQYHVFHMANPPKRQINGYNVYEFFNYPGMEADVIKQIEAMHELILGAIGRGQVEVNEKGYIYDPAIGPPYGR